jgi:hypothetical protein
MTRTPPLPAYEVPARSIIAMEHPMIIKNIDNGLKTFGNGVPIHQVGEIYIQSTPYFFQGKIKILLMTNTQYTILRA